jgi:hypothetical protein
MVFNATFNNILVICGGQLIMVEETGIYKENQTCRKSLTNFITSCCTESTIISMLMECGTIKKNTKIDHGI